MTRQVNNTTGNEAWYSKAWWRLPSFSAAEAALFVVHCRRWWACIVQQVSTQAYSIPILKDCSQHCAIFLKPLFWITSARAEKRISWKVTSSFPQVWDRIAYLGIFPGKNSSSWRVVVFMSLIMWTTRYSLPRGIYVFFLAGEIGIIYLFLSHTSCCEPLSWASALVHQRNPQFANWKTCECRP